MVQPAKDRIGTDGIRFSAAMARTWMQVAEIGGRRIGYKPSWRHSVAGLATDASVHCFIVKDVRTTSSEYTAHFQLCSVHACRTGSDSEREPSCAMKIFSWRTHLAIGSVYSWKD
jgi:hypothetical protein